MEHLILAAGGADFFTATPLGKAIGSIMKAVALLVVLLAAIKGIKNALGGNIGKAAQTIIGAVFIVAFLWDPSLITKVISLGSEVLGKTVDSVGDTTR